MVGALAGAATIAAGPRASGAARLALALAGFALALAAFRLARVLPPPLWPAAALDPAPGDARQLVFHYAALPRLAAAWLCGAALGLAGALFQAVLRNPLASGTTLGVEAGAQLALAAALIFAPALLAPAPGRDLVALVGAGAATGIVFLVAWARGFSSLSLVLAGLVVGLFCGALGAALKLLNEEYVAVLYVWGAGSLAQGSWAPVAGLVPRIAALAACVALLRRPVELLGLGDAGARALGLPLGVVRAAALAVAVGLTACVTAAFGVIGFVGLAAPQIAALAGARRLGDRLVLAPLVGAALLALVDEATQALGTAAGALIPTGAATALVGAPLLVWLLPRLRPDAPPAPEPVPATARARTLPTLAVLALGLALVAATGLAVAHGPAGWTLGGEGVPGALAWRLPRVAVALGAGAMLAVAGALLQRLTGNAMASPEVLGIGTGVALGLVVALLVDPAPGRAVRLAAGGAGALATLALLLSSGVRARFAPEPLLLTGIALGAGLDAIVVGFLALGDPRAGQMLAWISGSTYGADAGAATATLATALVLLPLALPLLRWLDLLPLGPVAAAGLGVPLGPARLAVTGLAAALTAAAMLVAGPLSFVGLMGPHLAAAVGLRRAEPHLAGAALIGAAVMVAADWLGRVAIEPRELPAGLVASLIGAPYLISTLTRRERR